MKTFDTLAFKPTRCREELDELGVLLDAQEELDERNDVLSFFRNRRQLSAFIGSYPPYLPRTTPVLNLPAPATDPGIQ